MSLCIQLVSPLELLVKAEPPVQMEADDMRVPLTLMTLRVAAGSARELIIPSFVSARAYGRLCAPCSAAGAAEPPPAGGQRGPAGSAAAVRAGSDAFAGPQGVSPARQKATSRSGRVLLLVLVSPGLRLLFFGSVQSVTLLQSRFRPLCFFLFPSAGVCQLRVVKNA